MAKVKFTYQKYDYSFLGIRKTDSLFNNAVSVAASTIGLDLITTETIGEPIGQVFYTDYVYEPMHSGGWEITLQTPQITSTSASYTIDGTSSAASTISTTTTASNNATHWYDYYYTNRR